MKLAVVVLAAGLGTRMRSWLPKVLHPLAGVPLLAHALATARTLKAERIVVVTGHGAEDVRAAAGDGILFAHQESQLGTGHAVLAARATLEDFEGEVIVLYGDTPLIRSKTLEEMRTVLRDGSALAVLGFHAADPGPYGRLILGEDGHLARIVEAKDATDAERAVTLCNSGVLAADSGLLFDLLSEIRPDNSKSEYYLTDVVGLATERGLDARVITCPEAETLGVNSRADLAAAEAAFQACARKAALENGVTLTAPETVHFSIDTHLGRDIVVEPNVVFGPAVTIADGARIRAFCHLERCRVGSGAVIGPFARIRPGTDIGAGAHIGNFVEIKAADIGAEAKVNHLTYIGDASVGAAANVGAGTVTCNYDGVFKHRTEIGANAFIGSDTMLVAPVRVGRDAMTASGSVITEDVPDGALGIGRSRQSVKPDLGRRIMDRLRALKAHADRS